MSQVPASFAQPPSFRTIIRGLMPSILFNAVLPYFVFTYMKSQMSASDLTALIVSGIPSLIYEVVTIIRQRQVDILGMVTLAVIVINLFLGLIGGDAKLLLIRESFVTVVLGAACIVSFIFKRPVLFYIIRYFATGNDPAKVPVFNTRWQYPIFRRYVRILNVVWGVTYLVEFAVRVVLVYNFSVQQSLAISNIAFTGLTIALFAFTVVYSRYVIRRVTDMVKYDNEIEAASVGTTGIQA